MATRKKIAAARRNLKKARAARRKRRGRRKRVKKWIQKAVPRSHKGKFTAWCKRHGFSGPTMACIRAAKRTHKRSIVGMATFAQRAKKGF